MRKFFTLRYLLLPVILFSLKSYAQVSITAGGATYVQNFNGLAQSGTSNVWTDNSTIAGWYSNRTVYIGDAGTSTTGALFSYGPNGNADRAIGAVTSGTTGTVQFGVRLVNNTGGPISGFAISFRGEQWRQTANLQTLAFGYLVGATSLTAGTWTSNTSFDFTSPKSGTAGALDGNTSANFSLISGTLNTTVANGQEIWLRWTKTGSTSPGIGIDDINITAITPISSDASLSNLVINQATLVPSFTSGTTSYRASVASSVTSISVTPTSSDQNSTITVNGNSVKSNTASNPVTLTTGDNIITTQVTAQDRTTKNTYTVTISRAAAGTPTITTTSPLSAFGNVCTNTTAGPNTFTISGSSLDGTPVSIFALPGFGYSENANGPFTNSLNISYTGSDFTGKVIYVNFSPIAAQPYDGNIVLNGGGISDYPVAAKGTGINSPATTTTGVSSSVKATTATVSASSTAGCFAITSYGFEYSPNTGFADGTGTVISSTNINAGNFSATITGLAPNTRYYYKSFVTSSAGTVYGTQQAFTNTALPVAMASQQDLTYTENFSDIANWTNFFVAGTGANHFGGLSASGTGGIPNGTTITTATNSFQGATFGTAGGVQKGTDQVPPTQSIVLLSTGSSSENSTSAAIDLYLDFTGVNAGTLSFDWASVNNSSGDRKGSLKVYGSTNGTSFTEIPAAAVLNFTNNNPTSGSISNIALPASFNNNPSVRLRFYYFNGTGGTTGSRPKISIDNLSVTAVPSVACSSPAAQPANMVFGTKTDVSIQGSFTAANPSSDQYLTVISNNSSLSSDPADGVIYNVGDAFGDGTVIAKGSSQTFTATGLSASTNYYFFTYAVNGICTGGPKYLITNPLTGSTSTNAGLPSCVAPSSQPSGLVFGNVGVNSIEGSFTPTTADAYLVLKSTSSTLSSSPVNGQAYNIGDAIGNATVIQRNAATTFNADGLTAGTTYYFYLFSLNSLNCINGPNYNTTAPLNASQSTQPLPPCVSPSKQPTVLTINTANTIVSGTFNASNTADNYLVIRSTSSTLSSTPVDNTDYNIGASLGGGTVIANSSATSFVSDNLSTATTYYFFVFAANKNCSGGTKYLANTPLTGPATTTNAQADNYYFGTLHAHSYYSDGNKDNPTYTPKDDYNYAMTALKMDFLGISEHNHFSSPHNPGNVITNFHHGFVEADSFTNVHPGFLAMYGMEWGVISGGGHVVVYGDGLSKLFGWESGSGGWGTSDNYDVYVPKSVYTGPSGLFKTINDYKANNAFGTLAHPNANDYNNLANIGYDAVADSAITGCAIESGPAFSTNTSYSDPAPASYLWYFQTMLSKGYHLGPTVDHDNHNTTFGHTAFTRTAVLAPSLSQTEIIKAMRNMHFYATEDGNSKVDFTINTKIMGSVFSDRNAPVISVLLSDATSNTSTAIIRVMFGTPGSGVLPVKIDSVIGNKLTFIDNNLPLGATGYYYIDITNGTARTVTSPIWYTRTCSVTSDTTMYACNSYDWNGQTYKESGTYTKSGFSTVTGCDSTAILHLTITNPTTGDTTASACGSFTWYGTTYTESAAPTHIFTALGGCDSTITLHLTINRGAATSETQVACDSLYWNGNTYSESGDYTFLSQNDKGCTDTATLHLTINKSTTTSENATACDSYAWHGTTYTTSGDYTYQSQNTDGCTNTATLHLTINKSTTTSENATACDSYAWHGTTYTTSGDYTYQSQNTSGCTNTATLHLTINKSTTTSENVTACDSYSWHGTTYTTSGDYTYQSQNTSGCTNTATLHLTINPKPVVTLPAASVLSQGVNANTLYVGYASEITYSAKVIGGSPTYTYQWSYTSGLTSITAANQNSIKISATGSGNYSSLVTVKVIDSKGCTATATVTVYVVDVRSGNKNDKVTVCQNGKELSLDEKAVAAHLNNGEKLGPCSTAIPANARVSLSANQSAKIIESEAKSFEVKVAPNPSRTDFKIVVSSPSSEPITIRLLDITGRVISIHNKIQRNETSLIGASLKGGSYLAEVIQGSNRKTVKLIKVN